MSDFAYPYKPRYRTDDPDLLLPSFRPVAERIFARLQELGFRPVVFDTLRTTEEALADAKKGTGVVDSMHLYGAACDIICNLHGWSCKAKGCKFFTALRRLALAECCIGPEGDMPHFQAVPVGRWQQAIRHEGVGNVDALDAVVRKYQATRRSTQ